jgi:hypothetical protein
MFVRRGRVGDFLLVVRLLASLGFWVCRFFVHVSRLVARASAPNNDVFLLASWRTATIGCGRSAVQATQKGGTHGITQISRRVCGRGDDSHRHHLHCPRETAERQAGAQRRKQCLCRCARSFVVRGFFKLTLLFTDRVWSRVPSCLFCVACGVVRCVYDARCASRVRFIVGDEEGHPHRDRK